jgi:excisionase family DNA binding protein
MPSDLMSVQDLAEYLGVARQTIYQWRYQGFGPDSVRVGGAVRYRRAEVDAWLEAHAERRQGA